MFAQAIPSGALDAFTLAFGRLAQKRAVTEDLSDTHVQHADEILSASDRQDVIDAMDEWILAAELLDRPSTKPEASPTPPDAPSNVALRFEAAAEEPLDVASLTRTLGDGPTQICLVGHGELRFLLKLVAGFLHGAANASRKDEPAPTLPTVRTFRDLIYAPEVPSGVRRAFIGLCRAGVAMAAIRRAETLPGKLAPWLALALAETYRDGFGVVAQGLAELLGGSWDGSAFRAAHRSTEKLRLAWWTELSGGDAFSMVGFPE